MTILVAILLLAACGRQPQYPQQLVEADSAMRRGQYHQLLTLESKFLRGNSSLDDLLLADNLRMFYEGSSKEKHAKALAILGDIYFSSYDYPSALEYLLKQRKKLSRQENYGCRELSVAQKEIYTESSGCLVK